MTSVNPAAASGQQQTAVIDQAKATLDYDAFLNLLLQQLKSQDPTAPVDQKETLAQLASFSAVEQSIKLNQKLDTLLEQSRVSEAGSLVGKTVEQITGSIHGVIRSVELADGKMFANLVSGERLELGTGLRIS